MQISPGTSSRNLKSLVVLVAVSCVLVTLRTWAAEPARVLVIAPAESRLQRLLLGEIRNLGLQPITDPEARAPDDAVSRASRATAVVCVAASGQALEIWVADRVSGKLVLRESVQGLGESNAEDVAVLRTSELLRANLIEVAEPKPTPPPPAASTSTSTPLPPPVEARPLSVSVGPVLVWGSRELPPVPGALFEIAVSPRDTYALGLWGVWTLSQQKASTSGTAAVSPRYLGLNAIRTFVFSESRWRAGVGASVAAQWLHVEGKAPLPFRASTDDHFTAVFLAQAQIAYAPLSRLRIAADVDAGATSDRTRVRVVGNDVAIWGPLLVLGSVRVEVLLP